MQPVKITFPQYKSAVTLEIERDLFDHISFTGATETHFLQWLSRQKGFSPTPPTKIKMPELRWAVHQRRYERKVRSSYAITKFPDGYFEAIRNEGRPDVEVACFLPEPSTKANYRISYYRRNGPTYHEVFDSRSQALSNLARGNFIAREGALDNLTDSQCWHRGLLICKWLSQGIHPTEGLKRHISNPEVQRLFAAEIKEMNKQSA